MNLKMYIKPLINYWWLILLAAVVAIATTFVVTYAQPSIYQTRATLVVGNMMYETNPSGNDIYLGQQLANYYARIGMQAEVSNSTKEALDMTWLPQYTVNPLPNSQFIEIVVNDSDPARAQAVANELARQLISHSPTSDLQQGSDQQAFINEQVIYLEEKIRETLSDIEIAEINLSETNSALEIVDAQAEITALQTKLSQMQNNYASLIANTGQGAINTLSVIEPALLPTSSIGPSKLMMTLIAGVVAAGIAAVAAFILELLDDTIKTPEEITKLLAMPMVGTIPSIDNPDGEGKSKLFMHIGRILNIFRTQEVIDNMSDEKREGVLHYCANFPQSGVAEKFRLLRFNLDIASIDKPLKSILITSPSSNEGKSSVASNLAMVMAEGGKKVVLLDVNFEQPNENMGIDSPNEKGLSSILSGYLEVSDVLQPWHENLSFISAGAAPSNPVDFFNSQRMNQVLEQLGGISDVVVIDGLSLQSTNSLALSAKADGVLVVLRYAFSRRGTAQEQVAKLTQIGARVMGVVLNKTPGT